MDERGAPDDQSAPDDLGSLVDRVPPGWSSVRYAGRRWGLARTDHADGRTVTIEAEALGGAGRVSANLIRLASGPLLRPCEIPAEEVLRFLRGWRPGPGRHPRLSREEGPSPR